MANSELGQFIEETMKAKGLTWREVAERAGIARSRMWWHDVASGRTQRITIHHLKALAKGLGVPSYYLFAVATGEPLPPDAYVTRPLPERLKL